MTPQNLHKNAVLQACFRLQAEIEMLLVAHPKAGARYGKSANVDLNPRWLGAQGVPRLPSTLALAQSLVRVQGGSFWDEVLT